jgi:hypothetical protein
MMSTTITIAIAQKTTYRLSGVVRAPRMYGAYGCGRNTVALVSGACIVIPTGAKRNGEFVLSEVERKSGIDRLLSAFRGGTRHTVIGQWFEGLNKAGD